MKHAKIEVTFDVTNANHVQSLNAFLMAIGDNSAGSKAEISKESKKEESATAPATEEPKRKRRTKAEIEAEKEQAAEVENEDVAEEEAEEVEAEETVSLKIEDVRPLLAKKVGTHRQAIKDKLTEFGAPNLTALEPKFYAEFVDFLNSLD